MKQLFQRQCKVIKDKLPIMNSIICNSDHIVKLAVSGKQIIKAVDDDIPFGISAKCNHLEVLWSGYSRNVDDYMHIYSQCAETNR